MKRSMLLLFRASFALLLLLGLGLAPSVSRGQADVIKSVVVVQALANQSNKYVAGKDTGVLVNLNAATAVDSTTQQVEIKLGGNTVATLQPTPSDNSVTTLVFLCPNRAACGDWKAGDYTFTATVGGATAQAAATFVERKGLKILALPVKANYGPGDVRSPTGTWRTMGDFTRNVYPLAPDSFNWTLGAEVIASDDKYNLTTDTGQAEMFQEAVKAQPDACFQKPRPASVTGCYDKVVAFVKDRMGNGTLQGFTMGYGTNIVVESDEDAAATVAHEIGHNYSLGDEYDGGQFNCGVNPPPASYAGKDFNNGDTPAPFSCTDSKINAFPNSSTSLITAADDVPFDTTGRGLLPDMGDFMGSGAPQNRNWISPADWSRIFDGLDPNAAPSGYESVGLSAPSSQTADRWIEATGFIGTDDSVQLDPWAQYSETGTQDNTTGKTYTLQAVDSGGTMLASTALAVDFQPVDVPKPLTSTLFVADMPFPTGTAKFQIMKGDKVLKELPVSANAPTVTITAPAAGEAISGDQFTLKWTGDDKDGDTLTYDVEYSPDGETWDFLESGLTDTQMTVDTNDLAGTADATARFRVTASDGVNSGEADSEPFRLAPKAPEAEIDSPEANATFAAGANVTLQGVGLDDQDGDITSDQQLAWSSDIQGALGNGEVLNLNNLKVGKHTITLTVTNSQKLTGTTTVAVTINAPTGAAPASPTSASPTSANPTTAPESNPTATESASNPPAVPSDTPGNAIAPAATATTVVATQSTTNSGGSSPLIWVLLAVVVIVIVVVVALVVMRQRGRTTQ